MGKIPLSSRFGERFVYAKFHIFRLLEEYENVIWLDCDVLVCGNISDFLCENVDFKCDCGGRVDGIQKYLEIRGLTQNNQKVFKPVGGVFCIGKNTLKNKKGEQLTKECFKILKELYEYGVLQYVATSNEMPFGVLAHLYRFNVENVQGNYNTLPSHSFKSKIIQAMGKNKFWESPFAFSAFYEWNINHKIWVDLLGGDSKNVPNLRETNFGRIDTPSSLHIFLIHYHLFCPLLPIMQEYINQNLFFGLYLKLPIKDRYLDIYSKKITKDIFYRFALNLDSGKPESASKCEVQIVCKEKEYLKEFQKNFLESLNQENYTLKNNKNAKGDEIVLYFTKNMALDYKEVAYQMDKLIKLTFKKLKKNKRFFVF